MLAVPAWLGRFGCRVTELAVDPARLRLSTPDADSAEAEVDEAVRRRIRSNGPQQAVVPLTPAGGAPAGGGFSSGEQIRPAGVAKEAPPGLLVRRVRLEDSTVGIYKCNGYLKISCNGGLNQIRSEICDMVAIARPELDKRSFWADQRFMKPEPLDWFELQKSIMSAELKLSSDLYYLEPSKNAPDGLVRMYGEGDMDGLLRAHSGTKLCHLYIVDQYFQRYYESDGMDDIVDDQYCTYSDGGMDDSD